MLSNREISMSNTGISDEDDIIVTNIVVTFIWSGSFMNQSKSVDTLRALEHIETQIDDVGWREAYAVIHRVVVVAVFLA